jgi:hypothetical protein
MLNMRLISLEEQKESLFSADLTNNSFREKSLIPNLLRLLIAEARHEGSLSLGAGAIHRSVICTAPAMSQDEQTEDTCNRIAPHNEDSGGPFAAVVIDGHRFCVNFSTTTSHPSPPRLNRRLARQGSTSYMPQKLASRHPPQNAIPPDQDRKLVPP